MLLNYVEILFQFEHEDAEPGAERERLHNHSSFLRHCRILP